MTSPARRFVGLDAIRFVCAYMVVSSHTPSILPSLRELGRAAELVGKVLRDTINGPAAVIVFFVISGFCIHWPYRNGERIGLDYFVRRYIRIGVPLGAALLISPFLGVTPADLVESVLWSLHCELIYYTLYPLLSVVAKRVGWRALVAATFAAALLLAIASPTPSGNYSSDDLFHASVLGLPCWLIGCMLAERQSFPIPSAGSIWLWRCAVFIGSIATLELRFHTALHFDVTLNFFAILVGYWLIRELGYGQKNAPWRWLEQAGAWSYSLYVLHPAASLVGVKLFPSWSYTAQWLVRMPLTLGICYLFYRAVERPSHQLARFAASALRAPAVSESAPLA
jgi:peptidoglycan/LPS O-acetylase OafA/YrhL